MTEKVVRTGPVGAIIKNCTILCWIIASQQLALAQHKVGSVLICNAQYKDSKFNNPHAGSAFLISRNQKVYACTAKHVLFFARTDDMNVVSFNGNLESWTFYSPLNKAFVRADGLLNENPKETLTKPLDGDWLIFGPLGPL